MHQRQYEPRSGGAEWVAPRDRPTVDIDALGVEADLVDARDRLGRERLVELREVDPLRREAGAREGLLARGDRPQAHVAWLDARRGRRHVARLRREAELLDRLLARDEDRRRTVVEARRVAGGDGAVLGER